MSSTVNVVAALRTRLTAASPGAAVSSALVEWVNKKLDPSGLPLWYRETFLPGIPRPSATGSSATNRFVGIYQVDVFGTVNEYDGVVNAEAERVSACYKRGDVLTYSAQQVHILKSYVNRISNREDPAWYQESVRIEWWADIAN